MLQVPVALAQAGPYHGASVRVVVGSKSLEASLSHLGGVPGAEMNVEMWGRGSYCERSLLLLSPFQVSRVLFLSRIMHIATSRVPSLHPSCLMFERSQTSLWLEIRGDTTAKPSDAEAAR